MAFGADLSRSGSVTEVVELYENKTVLLVFYNGYSEKVGLKESKVTRVHEQPIKHLSSLFLLTGVQE